MQDASCKVAERIRAEVSVPSEPGESEAATVTPRGPWDLQGVSAGLVCKRTFKAMLGDNLLSRAAEMGYYFLFALFPMLVCASSVLGLAARQAASIYDNLLHYLALVVPSGAYAMVIQTFNQTADHASGGKLTLGLVAALWSASVGFASIQDGMNTVYGVKETRPYWMARGSAILVTMLLAVMATINLAVLLSGDLLARLVYLHLWHHALAVSAAVAVHLVQWSVASVMLLLQLSTIYYFAPDLKNKQWQWVSPGAAIAVVGWVVASVGFRAYLHFFNSFSITYGSLGAVIVLLTWFYITGLMILLGAEINSEIETAKAERRLGSSASWMPKAIVS
jgi:membrane protein